jgi:acetylornithine deacetylase
MNSLEILERLVAFPTVSRDPNLPLIDYVRDFLAARGISAKLYPDASGRKANLLATLGPSDRSGVLLSGHTDVVPVDGQPWSTDPFRLHERSGRLYGRGAADMKGFIACALACIDRASSRRLAVPLQLALSYDEELGCLGVHSLITDLAGWTHRPRFCIVGEPTLLRPGIGHKGKTALRAVCRGQAAHSSSPARGINAVYMACDLIGRLRRRQEDISAGGVRDPGYEVPYTTLHAGVIHGGTVNNIVPPLCEVELEFRNVPGDDQAALEKGLREDAAVVAGEAAAAHTAAGGTGGASIDLTVAFEYPWLDADPDDSVVQLAAALTGNHERIKVGFGSEAGLFVRDARVPSVLCGPGSIDQAHRPDEFIEREQMLRCDAMLDALLDRLT